MLSNSIELVDRHLAQNVSIDITRQMVRIDSTNGKEADLGNRLAAQLELIGVGRVWVEEVFDGRVNTFWEIDSGKPGPHLLFTGHLDTKPVCEGGPATRSMLRSSRAACSDTA